MCSLEVPDIKHAIADQYTADELQVFLVNTEDPFERAHDFMAASEVELTTLLDGQDTYFSYPRSFQPSYAPYPLQVVIDPDGVIRYLSYQYDAEAVRAAIDAALADR